MSTGRRDARHGDCRYEQATDRVCRITGARWAPAAELRVKIEGARKVGERCMGVVGIRDPFVVRTWTGDRVVPVERRQTLRHRPL